MDVQVIIEGKDNNAEFIVIVDGDTIARDAWNDRHPFWKFNIVDLSPEAEYIIFKHYAG